MKYLSGFYCYENTTLLYFVNAIKTANQHMTPLVKLMFLLHSMKTRKRSWLKVTSLHVILYVPARRMLQANVISDAFVTHSHFNIRKPAVLRSGYNIFFFSCCAKPINCWSWLGMQACRLAGIQVRRHAATQACRNAAMQPTTHTRTHARTHASTHARTQLF